MICNGADKKLVCIGTALVVVVVVIVIVYRVCYSTTIVNKELNFLLIPIAVIF